MSDYSSRGSGRGSGSGSGDGGSTTDGASDQISSGESHYGSVISLSSSICDSCPDKAALADFHFADAVSSDSALRGGARLLPRSMRADNSQASDRVRSGADLSLDQRILAWLNWTSSSASARSGTRLLRRVAIESDVGSVAAAVVGGSGREPLTGPLNFPLAAVDVPPALAPQDWMLLLARKGKDAPVDPRIVTAFIAFVTEAHRAPAAASSSNTPTRPLESEFQIAKPIPTGRTRHIQPTPAFARETMAKPPGDKAATAKAAAVSTLPQRRQSVQPVSKPGATILRANTAADKVLCTACPGGSALACGGGPAAAVVLQSVDNSTYSSATASSLFPA
jgi:hypothetical protein